MQGIYGKMKRVYEFSKNTVEVRLSALVRVVSRNTFAYRRVFVFEEKFQTTRLEPKNKAKVNVRLAQSRDFPRLIEFGKRLWTPNRVKEEFKAGHSCLLAEKDGDIVSFVWVRFDEPYINELERKMKIGPTAAYYYAGYTVPACRGKGILPMLLFKASDYAFQKGVKEVYTLTDSYNYSSQRATKKGGMRKMGEVSLIRVFKLKRYKCKGETQEDSARLREIFFI